MSVTTHSQKSAQESEAVSYSVPFVQMLGYVTVTTTAAGRAAEFLVNATA